MAKTRAIVAVRLGLASNNRAPFFVGVTLILVAHPRFATRSPRHMPLGPIQLRIVGLYFNTTVNVDIPEGGFVTIKGVLDAYIATHPITAKGGLGYTIQSTAPVGTSDTLLTFTHYYGGKYDFN